MLITRTFPTPNLINLFWQRGKFYKIVLLMCDGFFSSFSGAHNQQVTSVMEEVSVRHPNAKEEIFSEIRNYSF